MIIRTKRGTRFRRGRGSASRRTNFSGPGQRVKSCPGKQLRVSPQRPLAAVTQTAVPKASLAPGLPRPPSLGGWWSSSSALTPEPLAGSPIRSTSIGLTVRGRVTNAHLTTGTFSRPRRFFFRKRPVPCFCAGLTICLMASGRSHPDR